VGGGGVSPQDVTARRILVDLAGRAKWILRGLAAAGCATDDDDLRWALHIGQRPPEHTPTITRILEEVDRQCDSAGWPHLSALCDGSAAEIAAIHRWALAERVCRYCASVGHVARDCPRFLVDWMADPGI